MIHIVDITIWRFMSNVIVGFFQYIISLVIANIIHIKVNRIIGSIPSKNTLKIALDGVNPLTSISSTKQSNEKNDSFGFPILFELSKIKVK